MLLEYTAHIHAHTREWQIGGKVMVNPSSALGRSGRCGRRPWRRPATPSSTNSLSVRRTSAASSRMLCTTMLSCITDATGTLYTTRVHTGRLRCRTSDEFGLHSSICALGIVYTRMTLNWLWLCNFYMSRLLDRLLTHCCCRYCKIALLSTSFVLENDLTCLRLCRVLLALQYCIAELEWKLLRVQICTIFTLCWSWILPEIFRTKGRFLKTSIGSLLWFNTGISFQNWLLPQLWFYATTRHTI